jgi:hypothetical protein
MWFTTVWIYAYIHIRIFTCIENTDRFCGFCCVGDMISNWPLTREMTGYSPVVARVVEHRCSNWPLARDRCIYIRFVSKGGLYVLFDCFPFSLSLVIILLQQCFVCCWVSLYIVICACQAFITINLISRINVNIFNIKSLVFYTIWKTPPIIPSPEWPIFRPPLYSPLIPRATDWLQGH